MIRAHQVGETSAFLGQTCALCKQEFAVGDDIVVCPADGSRHHVHCWRANGNKCTAYGCRGQGEVGTDDFPARPVREPTRARVRPRVIEQPAERPSSSAARPVPGSPGSKVRTLPSGSIGCAQFCLLIAIAVAIVLIAIGCYGLWAIADYLMQEVWHLPYREPLSAAPLLLSLLSRSIL